MRKNCRDAALFPFSAKATGFLSGISPSNHKSRIKVGFASGVRFVVVRWGGEDDVAATAKRQVEVTVHGKQTCSSCVSAGGVGLKATDAIADGRSGAPFSNSNAASWAHIRSQSFDTF